MSLIVIFTKTAKYTLLLFRVQQVHILHEVIDTLEIMIYFYCAKYLCIFILYSKSFHQNVIERY